jgi:hypothetical protein
MTDDLRPCPRCERAWIADQLEACARCTPLPPSDPHATDPLPVVVGTGEVGYLVFADAAYGFSGGSA